MNLYNCARSTRSTALSFSCSVCKGFGVQDIATSASFFFFFSWLSERHENSVSHSTDSVNLCLIVLRCVQPANTCNITAVYCGLLVVIHATHCYSPVFNKVFGYLARLLAAFSTL